MRFKFLYIFTVLTLSICWVPAFGQNADLPLVSKTLAFKNVTVYTHPNEKLESATIIIKDGLITQVGINIEIPPDARILEADSMHVYAGFIGGLSYAGNPRLPDNQNTNDERKFSPGNPPDEVAGITPHNSLRSTYDHKEKSIIDLRKLGFTVMHSVPRGRMMPGKGSVLLLTGKDFDGVVLKEDISLFAQFSAARNVYPSTVIGIMAKWRDLYKNAELAMLQKSAFSESPSGLNRPQPTQAEKALFPIVKNELPVFFKTEDRLSISRAKVLADELGFVLIPSEVKQGSSLIESDIATNHPIVLSLDIPEIKKKKDEKPEEDKEKMKLKKRLDDSKKEYIKQAADFESAKIAFSFSLLNVKAKAIIPNLRNMLSHGLSEPGALAALTTHPAKQLGIDKIAGTIEIGKLGNVVVSTKPIFDEKSQVKYVVVDGVLFENEIKKIKKKIPGSEDAEPIDLSGTWIYTIEIPGNVVEGKMIISKVDDNYTVKVSNDQQPGEFKTVEGLEADGNNLSFSIDIDAGGNQMRIEYDIDFEEDSCEGSVAAGQFGNFPLTGDKDSEPNKN